MQIIFCASFLVGKKYAERFFGSDVAALVLVCAGYYVFQWISPEGKRDRQPRGAAGDGGDGKEGGSSAQTPMISHPDSEGYDEDGEAGEWITSPDGYAKA